MPTHTQNTGGYKVALAKLGKTSMKNCEDSKPKLTTALQFGQWPDKKVTIIPQIHESFLGMSCTTRLQIRKVDRRCESRCADTLAKHRGDTMAIAKLDRTPMKNCEDSKPKLTTVLQVGQWPDKKVTTVPQIDKSFLRMPCLIRKLELCKCEK